MNLKVQSTWQGWQVAVLILIALFIFVLVRLSPGQDMPPMPPIFPLERVITAPQPEHMLLSPHQTKNASADAAMVTLVWDYSVPNYVETKPVQSPKGAETYSGTAMKILIVPYSQLVISNTCSFKAETSDQKYVTWELQWTGDLQTSTNLKDWENVNDGDPTQYLADNIVGYFVKGDTNEARRYFRAVPK